MKSVLIAPDKFRGTLSAHRAARIMAAACPLPCVTIPMADGGEGTRRQLCDAPGWQSYPEKYSYNAVLRHAVVESAQIIGYDAFAPDVPAMQRTSRGLGLVLNTIRRRHNPLQIFVGVGGTATCDGGAGMLDALDDADWSTLLTGLVDTQVPLLPARPAGDSALMFCPQKGFTAADIELTAQRLADVQRVYGAAHSPFDGAGGGVGYALASVLGAQCHPGAQWLMNRAKINWNDISLAITGEGRYDRQTSRGKVVATVADAARRHGVPTVAFCGCVSDDATAADSLTVVDCSQYLPDSRLTPQTADQRLTTAVSNYFAQ